MDNFKAVYKILTALEKAMDLTEFDISQVGPEALGVTQERWNRYTFPRASGGDPSHLAMGVNGKSFSPRKRG